MSNIMQEWKQKQYALKAEGLDRQRNNDLTMLKAMGEPFTTATDVDDFMAGGLSDTDQNNRLYIEVNKSFNYKNCVYYTC